MTRDEQRKYKYAMERAGVTQEYIDGRFQMIDAYMQVTKVGDKVYEWAAPLPDAYYKKTITSIVDFDMGIVETYGDGVNKREIRCILEYKLSPLKGFMASNIIRKGEENVK